MCNHTKVLFTLWELTESVMSLCFNEWTAEQLSACVRAVTSSWTQTSHCASTAPLTCHISCHKSARLTAVELNYAILWSQHVHCHRPTSWRGGTYCYGKKHLMSYNGVPPLFCTTWSLMARGDWNEVLVFRVLLSSATYCAEFSL